MFGVESHGCQPSAQKGMRKWGDFEQTSICFGCNVCGWVGGCVHVCERACMCVVVRV